jgi:hypothetical protein
MDIEIGQDVALDHLTIPRAPEIGPAAHLPSSER